MVRFPYLLPLRKNETVSILVSYAKDIGFNSHFRYQMKIRKNNCLFCLKEFVGDYRKKFCNHTCAAHYNAKPIDNRTSVCVKCSHSFPLEKKDSGGFHPKKLCEVCFAEASFENQTKGSLYSRRKDWQSANSTLRKHSRKVYVASGRSQKCRVCEYDGHYEVCHIKPIKDFPDDAKVLEINAIDNLVALCRNHHWEHDNMDTTAYMGDNTHSMSSVSPRLDQGAGDFRRH